MDYSWNTCEGFEEVGDLLPKRDKYGSGSKKNIETNLDDKDSVTFHPLLATHTSSHDFATNIRENCQILKGIAI
jgi:hypothetical protein